MNKKSLVVKIAVLAVMLVTVVVLAGCSSTANVGTLDMNKVMAEAPKVKDLQKQLEDKGKQLTEKMEKDKAGKTAEEQSKLEQDAYSEFLKFRQELEGQIDATLKQAVEQVAKEKKLTTVVYKQAIAFGGTDVTDEVLKKMQ